MEKTKTKKTNPKGAVTGKKADRTAETPKPSAPRDTSADLAKKAAVDFMRRTGHLVVDENPSAAAKTREPAASFVVWDEHSDEMAFVRVVRCTTKDTAEDVKRGVRSKDFLRRMQRYAIKWSKTWDWKGKRRFDRIEVYGDDETKRPTFDWTQNAKGEI